MWSRALRFHLGVHDKRQDLSASAGAVALRTAARKLRRASSRSGELDGRPRPNNSFKPKPLRGSA
jgi:hypothetical protein